MISPRDIAAFQRKILSWYALNERDLPWRRTRDPYPILISEVMLQQTQVARVIPKFEAWLAAFPTVTHLAQASTADVLRHWSGLGYNRRALYLKRAAEAITQRENGRLTHVAEATRRPLENTQSQMPSSLIERRSLKVGNRSSEKYESAFSSSASGQSSIFPNTVEELRELPGIGEYTARAVACFAFDAQIAVVDTNVRKVIITQFGISHDATPKEIQEIADTLLPVGKAYEWNQALMDYSSAVLSGEKIPIPKQSKFKGSNRYYRGQIIKVLIERKQLSIQEIVRVLDKDEAFLRKIIEGLVKDGFITREKEMLRLLS